MMSFRLAIRVKALAIRKFRWIKILDGIGRLNFMMSAQWWPSDINNPWVDNDAFTSKAPAENSQTGSVPASEDRSRCRPAGVYAEGRIQENTKSFGVYCSQFSLIPNFHTTDWVSTVMNTSCYMGRGIDGEFILL